MVELLDYTSVRVETEELIRKNALSALRTVRIVTECKNRLERVCSNCTPDVDPNHHPNNKNCPNFRPVYLEVYA